MSYFNDKKLSSEKFRLALLKTKSPYVDPPVILLSEPPKRRTMTDWHTTDNNFKQYNCLPRITKENFREIIEHMASSLGFEYVWIPTKFAVHIFWSHVDENIYNITFRPYTFDSDIIMLELYLGTLINYDILYLIRFYLQQYNIISNEKPHILSSYVLESHTGTSEQLSQMFKIAIIPNGLGMEYSMFSLFLHTIKNIDNHEIFIKANPDAITILFDIMKGAISESNYRMKTGFHDVYSDNHSRCATTVVLYLIKSSIQGVSTYVKHQITSEHIKLLEQLVIIDPRIIPSIANHAKEILKFLS